jgi:hypothetical protein
MTKISLSVSRVIIPALALFAFSLLITSCSSSRKSIPVEQGWDLLGEQKVNFVRDRDAITVYNTNRYTAIRFKVENKEIILNDLKIVYENGDKLTPTISDKIGADQYSREIELGPEGKSIRTIEFKFRSTGNLLKGRANVLVYGKRYTQPY